MTKKESFPSLNIEKWTKPDGIVLWYVNDGKTGGIAPQLEEALSQYVKSKSGL